jgi:hypothetical protein
MNDKRYKRLDADVVRWLSYPWENTVQLFLGVLRVLGV